MNNLEMQLLFIIFFGVTMGLLIRLVINSNKKNKVETHTKPVAVREPTSLGFMDSIKYLSLLDTVHRSIVASGGDHVRHDTLCQLLVLVTKKECMTDITTSEANARVIDFKTNLLALINWDFDKLISDQTTATINGSNYVGDVGIILAINVVKDMKKAGCAIDDNLIFEISNLNLVNKVGV